VFGSGRNDEACVVSLAVAGTAVLALAQLPSLGRMPTAISDLSGIF
jgi:hypothetical protein